MNEGTDKIETVTVAVGNSVICIPKGYYIINTEVEKHGYDPDRETEHSFKVYMEGYFILDADTLQAAVSKLWDYATQNLAFRRF